jgi:hypothetical protein
LNSKTKQQGLYTVVTSAWVFIPAIIAMEPQELKSIKEKHIKAINNAASLGLKKQLKLQLEWLDDPNESRGE